MFSLIYSSAFVERHKTSEKAFIRERKLPFSHLMLFLMNLVKGSLQEEIDGFFKVINNSEIEQRVLSKAAVSKARRHLSYKAFVELNDELINQYYDNCETYYWHDLRVCAIDGSTLRLPNQEEIVEHFGGQKNGKLFCPLARKLSKTVRFVRKRAALKCNKFKNCTR